MEKRKIITITLSVALLAAVGAETHAWRGRGYRRHGYRRGRYIAPAVAATAVTAAAIASSDNGNGYERPMPSGQVKQLYSRCDEHARLTERRNNLRDELAEARGRRPRRHKTYKQPKACRCPERGGYRGRGSVGRGIGYGALTGGAIGGIAGGGRGFGYGALGGAALGGIIGASRNRGCDIFRANNRIEDRNDRLRREIRGLERRLERYQSGHKEQKAYGKDKRRKRSRSSEQLDKRPSKRLRHDS